MTSYVDGICILDNIIECSVDSMNVVSTYQYLQKDLKFIRVTHRPIHSSEYLIFGDHVGLSLTKDNKDGNVITKINQL